LKDDSTKSPGAPVSIVSVYGMTPEQHSTAERLINPIGALHTQHCSKYLIAPEQAAEAQRILHKLTASRIPSDSGEPCHPSL